MLTKILSYLSVVAGAMLKFIFGPILGFLAQLSFIETWLCTVIGMMTSVLAVVGLGTPLRKWLLGRFAKQQKKFSPRKRMIVRVWKKYGLIGISFLTPLILTPLGGTLIAVALGGKPKTIITTMLISAIVLGGILTILVFVMGKQFTQWVGFN